MPWSGRRPVAAFNVSASGVTRTAAGFSPTRASGMSRIDVVDVATSQCARTRRQKKRPASSRLRKIVATGCFPGTSKSEKSRQTQGFQPETHRFPAQTGFLGAAAAGVSICGDENVLAHAAPFPLDQDYRPPGTAIVRNDACANGQQFKCMRGRNLV